MWDDPTSTEGPKERDTLVLNYTMTCPLKCDFCCYGCHPKRSEKMPLEHAIRLVNEASEIPSITCLGLTGGEPLWYWAEVSELMRAACNVKLPFTIATAAPWAENPNEASSRIEFMVNNGIRRANISCDPSHEEFVSRKAVERAATLFVESGIETHVVGTFKTEETMHEYFKNFPTSPLLTIHSRFVAKVGRATKWDNAIESTDINSLACYRRINHDLVVFYDGMAYPCCSTFNRATPGIAIGNAFSEPLKIIWSRVEGSLKFRMMKREGFGRVYEIIKARDPALFAKLPPVDGCQGPCSFCNKIFKSKELTDEINQFFSNYEIEKINDLFHHVEGKYGTEKMKKLIANYIGE
ncbi:radical SAM/SPASM domain-containing protein [Candidimonas nitroreducens]|uniref:Radical SAM core domain-containing protein n=1 Tax=Candidimonas nitroreducens TaxID=683354 RepID=A0A225M6M0_9BURK|nr:radical SAM protein [Candidimonas nitroreducens]OWT56918.1 hypothetical protein CEY11_18775 [Candidimonas nitroreducens]